MLSIKTLEKNKKGKEKRKSMKNKSTDTGLKNESLSKFLIGNEKKNGRMSDKG